MKFIRLFTNAASVCLLTVFLVGPAQARLLEEDVDETFYPFRSLLGLLLFEYRDTLSYESVKR